LTDIFEEGASGGEFKPDLDPRIARDMVVGIMDHTITRWLLKDRAYSLFNDMESIFGLFIDAFKAARPNQQAGHQPLQPFHS
jgi:TetR/AcrR family fatty acid metabolism transcriptional regulator